MTPTIQPEKLLKDLAKLWADLGKEDSKDAQAGVLRACAMTLIVTVEEDADAQAVGETIAELMHQHPSRVIVMKVTDDFQDALDARVFAQCWMPFGRRQQICCEEIEISASLTRTGSLPKLVLGLMAPDLPVVLWCRSEKLCRDSSFQQLFRLTDKIIVDSSSFEFPSSALRFIRELTASGRNIGDLTWTRLTHLREAVAQIFENPEARAHLGELQKVTISYSGRMPVSVEYLLSWLRSATPAPVETVHTGTADGGEIRGIRFEGPGFEAAVEITDSMADIRVNQLARRLSFPRRGDCDLMREEMSILGVDPIFRKCLA